jgi:hypothetical protein
MNRHERRGRQADPIPPEILASDAWRSLTPTAKKVLRHLASRYDGTNNGMLPYEPRDAAAIGIDEREAKEALRQLVDVGLLNRTEGTLQ